MSEKTKLNIGCGKAKLEGYINIDIDPLSKHDILLDIRKNNFPYKDKQVSEILFVHTIEHIEKRYYNRIFAEFWRVLEDDGKLVIAYPEFLKCAENYRNNLQGEKVFWEATIYGRQLYPGDYHVSLMETTEFVRQLYAYGFYRINYTSEPEPRTYNTIVVCYKDANRVTFEDIKRREVYAD